MSLSLRLNVSGFARSLRFYTDVLGFVTLRYDAEQRCAEVERDGIAIEIGESSADIAPLEYPFGRGVTIIVWTRDVEAVLAGIEAYGARLHSPPAIREHVEDGRNFSHVAFDVCDPDGYKLRFCQSLAAE